MSKEKRNRISAKERQQQFIEGSTGDFLNIPCSADLEGKLKDKLAKKPLNKLKAEPKKEGIYFEAFPEIALERVTIIEPCSGHLKKESTYVFPAGLLFTLTIDVITDRLNFTYPFWEFKQEDIEGVKKLVQLNDVCNSSDYGIEVHQLYGIAGLMNKMLAEQGKKQFEKEISEAGVSGLIDSIGLSPSFVVMDKEVVDNYQDNLDRTDGINSGWISSCADVLYYSLRYFSTHRDYSRLHQCPMCKRLYFYRGGNQQYCLFRSPFDSSMNCIDAAEQIRALDSKKRESIAKKKKVVTRRLSEMFVAPENYHNSPKSKFREEWKKLKGDTKKNLKQYEVQLMVLEGFAQEFDYKTGTAEDVSAIFDKLKKEALESVKL